MAFRLLGAAMEKKDDPVIRKEWTETVDDLYDRTHESRNLIKNKAHISDKELQSILPIHPYTALMLRIFQRLSVPTSEACSISSRTTVVTISRDSSGT